MSCRKCWAGYAKAVEVAKEGEVIAVGMLCDACLEKAVAGADALRAEFDELIVAGVSRENANAHIIRKIEGEAAS